MLFEKADNKEEQQEEKGRRKLVNLLCAEMRPKSLQSAMRWSSRTLVEMTYVCMYYLFFFLSQIVVGWYSTEGGFESSDILIQEHFDSETLGGPCVHLIVDTTLQNAQMAIRAYTAQALVIGGGSVATHFIEIPIEYRSMDIERVGTGLLSRSVVDDIPTDAESFGAAIQKFSEVIERVRETGLVLMCIYIYMYIFEYTLCSIFSLNY